MWSLFSRKTRSKTPVLARRFLSRPRLEFLEDRLCLSKLFASGVYANKVYRYDVQPTDTPVLDLTISDSSFNAPTGLAFSPTNELFVVNSASITSTTGTVSRFLDPGGTPTPNPIQPVITDSHFGFPFGAVFVGGELYVANVIRGNNVLWFTFDRFGNAVFDKAVATDLTGNAAREITVSPGNELFVAQCCGVNNVKRYVFDATGNTIPNGVITGGGLNGPHGLTLSPWGELFVANLNGNSISRFIFDDAGNALPNGVITGSCLNGPVGLAFSPWGELFVSNGTAPGGICTWTFDDLHNATFNRSFTSPDRLSFIKFLPEGGGGGGSAASFPPAVGEPSAIDVSPSLTGGTVPLIVLLTGQRLERNTIDVATVGARQNAESVRLSPPAPAQPVVERDTATTRVVQAASGWQAARTQVLDRVFADLTDGSFDGALVAEQAAVW
jgi:hypothetical protein